jgi:hypothetical protein
MTRMSRSVVATVGLVGALSTAALPAVHASTHVSRAPAAGCRGFAKHHFVEALSAKNHGTLTRVMAHPAKFVCGGPDDFHYTVNEKKTVRLTVHAAANIKVLKSAGGSSTRAIAPARLPHELRHDGSDRIFRINGPHTHINRMVEQFHP